MSPSMTASFTEDAYGGGSELLNSASQWKFSSELAFAGHPSLFCPFSGQLFLWLKMGSCWMLKEQLSGKATHIASTLCLSFPVILSALELSSALSPPLCSEISLQDSLVFFLESYIPNFLFPASSSITNLPSYSCPSIAPWTQS